MMRTIRQLPRWSAPLSAAGAVLLLVTAGIHLDLYLTGYKSIPTIGALFLLQVAAAIALALGVLGLGVIRAYGTDARGRWSVMATVLAWAGATVFALGTIVAYALSRAVGLFGFHEQPTTAGVVAGLLEVGAFVALGSLVMMAIARSSSDASSTAPATGRRFRPLILGVISAALLVVVLTAGVGSATTPTAPNGPASASSPAHRHAAKRPANEPVVHVEISDYAYHPDRVTARPGETIAVTNDDQVTHTMTAIPGSAPFGDFDSGYIDPGHTARFKAPKAPGTYAFYCRIHHFMRGQLVVNG
ncbi:MAG: cupredoxin domain-containing protein [Acidimicrobiales bacterium]